MLLGLYGTASPARGAAGRRLDSAECWDGRASRCGLRGCACNTPDSAAQLWNSPEAQEMHSLHPTQVTSRLSPLRTEGSAASCQHLVAQGKEAPGVWRCGAAFQQRSPSPCWAQRKNFHLYQTDSVDTRIYTLHRFLQHTPPALWRFRYSETELGGLRDATASTKLQAGRPRGHVPEPSGWISRTSIINTPSFTLAGGVSACCEKIYSLCMLVRVKVVPSQLAVSQALCRLPHFPLN